MGMRAFFLTFISFALLIISGEVASAQSGLVAKRSINAPAAFVSACHRYSWLCRNRPGRAIPDDEALALLRNVNSRVNSSVTPAEDTTTAGVADYWSLPIGGRGDCEDYAILKKKDLIDAGFQSDKLVMAIVLDHNSKGHAVLVARLKAGDYVLDNLSNSVSSWDRTGYTFVAQQSFENLGRWKVILSSPLPTEVSGL
jgi:predicted transglutaminase-like cysteine proteinase